MDFDDLYIIATLFLVANACSILGTFLILNKAPLLGDAISHSVLPGIVLAFYFASGFNSTYTLVGAAAFGVGSTWLIEFISSRYKIRYEASMGMIFTLLFAVGVILINTIYEGQVDLDQDCVLNGNIEFIVFDTIDIVGSDIPLSLIQLLVINCIILICLIISFNLYRALSFDKSYSKLIGIKTNVLKWIFNFIISVVIVFSFEIVGVILVVGFMIIIPSISLLFSKKLKNVFALNAIISILVIGIGFPLSFTYNTATSPTVIFVAFVLVLVIVALKQISYYK
jgi:manganese/zinc/iron transport system permease protein